MPRARIAAAEPCADCGARARWSALRKIEGKRHECERVELCEACRSATQDTIRRAQERSPTALPPPPPGGLFDDAARAQIDWITQEQNR